MAAAALAAVGLALAQSFQNAPSITPGVRIASRVLEWRAAQPRPATRTTADPLPVLGAAVLALVAARRRRATRTS
jgi:hypothetical protein